MTDPARGLVLGKFMPPHMGHRYLIDFAREWADELTVVVGTLAAEPIPGALRHRWVTEMFPSVNVVHLTDENPQEPHEHPDFWDIWRESLLRVLPQPPDYVFASEPYGLKLAEVLGARFIPVDISRRSVPISGTAVRDDPIGQWSHIPPCVRPYFVKRVCLFGPESTGKSTIARRLADRYRTVVVPEYARELLELQDGEIVAADMPRIARGQIAAEEALARQANRVLFCDTDVLTTVVWSEVLYDSCDPWMRGVARQRTYDLTLLTDIDVPWEPDPVRCLPDDREGFLARCTAALDDHGRPYLKLTGDRETRLAAACAAVDAMLYASSAART